MANNHAINSMPRWLNSISSQLTLSQLVTVLAAISTATLTTLAIGRESVLRANEQHLRADAQIIQRTYDSNRNLDDPKRRARLSQLLGELSGPNHAYWISQANEDSILPAATSESIPIPKILQIEQASRDLPINKNWLTSRDDLRLSLDQQVKIEGMHYAVSYYQGLSAYTSLWVVQDITALTWLQHSILQTAAGIFIGSCSISLLVSALLTRYIVAPVKTLARHASQIEADNLTIQPLAVSNRSNEVRELCIAFNSLLDRLHKGMEDQKQFTRAVSHELRNPLMTIELCQRRLKRELGAIGPEVDDALLIEQRELSRMKRLLNDLLRLFQASQSGATAALEAVDLEAVSRDAIAAATTQNQAFPPEIIKAADSGSDSSAWLAWAHRDRLEQALINLLGNASKYSAADQPIRIRLERQGDELALSIEDRGVGIPLEEQSSIYKPFFRGSNSGPQEGSGLGLPIVKALVESMGGRLQLWSRPNQGSRFTILLPRADANSAPSQRLA